MNEKLFVVVKLISGETIMATYVEQVESDVVLLNPMVIKSTPYLKNGELKEHISIAPWSSFTADVLFDIHESHIVYVKELHETFVNHYLDAVEQSMQTEEDISTVQELYESITEPEDQEDTFTFSVKGNETVH